MQPHGSKMNETSSENCDEVFTGCQNSEHNENLSSMSSSFSRLPSAVSCDMIKPKHFHHPEYFEGDQILPVKKVEQPRVNLNPESGVDHSSLLEEYTKYPDNHDMVKGMEKGTWYTRWADKDEIDHDEEEERKKIEKRRKREEELKKLQCSLGNILLKEEKQEELRMERSLLDPRLTSRSPNANVGIHSRIRYSTPASSSPSRIVKEARKSLNENSLSTNGNSPVVKVHVQDFNANASKSNGASSRNSSESGSALELHESKCANQVTQSMPEIRNIPKYFPYHILKTTNARRPIGVDKTALEKHLHPKEFEKVFSMTRDQFYHLTPWRQVEMKKKVYLF